MAWTHVFAYDEALGIDGGTSGTFDSTGADTLFLVFGTIDADANTISDSKGNNWTLVRDHNGGFDLKCYLYRSDTPATVGSGHTITVSNTGAKIAIAVEGMAGGATSSIDDQENSNGALFSQTLQPGSITPSEDNTVVITGIMASDNDREPTSINGGFTVAASSASTGENLSINIGIAYLIQTTAAAANPTWTLANGAAVHENAVIASFKATAGGGGGAAVDLFSGVVGGRLLGGLMSKEGERKWSHGSDIGPRVRRCTSRSILLPQRRGLLVPPRTSLRPTF